MLDKTRAGVQFCWFWGAVEVFAYRLTWVSSVTKVFLAAIQLLSVFWGLNPWSLTGFLISVGRARAGGQLGVIVGGRMHRSVGMCWVLGGLKLRALKVGLKLLCAFVICTALVLPCFRLFCTFCVHEDLYYVFFKGDHAFIISLSLGSVWGFSLWIFGGFLLLLLLCGIPRPWMWVSPNCSSAPWCLCLILLWFGDA